MIWAGMVNSSLIDFPGCPACVLFTRGCPYDCFYCHNRDAIEEGGKILEEDAVLRFLRKRRGLLDGVVVSGGEPTLQPDLPAFFHMVREMGYQIKLDTNGARPDLVRLLLKEHLVDYVAVDVKAPWERYEEICGPGADAGQVRSTLAVLQNHDVPWEARTTVAPTLTPKDIIIVGATVPAGVLWRLNPYRVPERYRLADAVRVHAPALDRHQLMDMMGDFDAVHRPIAIGR